MPSKSTIPKTSSSPSMSPAVSSASFSKLSEVAPEKVQDLCQLLNNQDLWPRLEEFLRMVRQDHLESLLSSSDTEVIESKAIIGFIDNFTGLLKVNLNAQNQDLKDNKAGLPSKVKATSEYIDISPDLDDLTELGSPN